MEISLKEARETEYWLIVLVESEAINPEKVKCLRQQIDIIIRILVTITKKVKEKHQTPNPELRTPNSGLMHFDIYPPTDFI